jgi:hypothetical protein
MRAWMLLAIALVAAPVVPSHAAHAAEAGKDAKPAVTKDGWPDTPAGRTARDWVAAFNTGETAMKTFLTAHVPPEEFKKKSMAERMETYRTNRDRFGKLTLGSITSSTPSELEVSLLDEDLSPMPYTFTVEKEEPYRLVSITRKEMRGHMGFGGFHH